MERAAYLKVFGVVLTMVIICSLFVSCAPSKSTPATETQIPSDYTTDTSEGLFSISYPPDWEHFRAATELFDRVTKEVLITAIESDLPVDLGNMGSTIFWVNAPSEEELTAYTIIYVDSPPVATWTLENVVEAGMPSSEFSRVETTVGGREVVIIDYKVITPINTYGDTTVGGEYHYLKMVTLVGKTAWTISCVARSPEIFSDYEDDFNAIVRSFRMLNSATTTNPTPTPTPTTMTPVTFPDANLEAAIRETINKPEGSIYPSDLESLTRLIARDKNIVDLRGLEYCVNLTQLWLDRNNISDLSPLADLTNLDELMLGDNNINDLSTLAGLTKLLWLDLTDNDISDISPLAGLTK